MIDARVMEETARRLEKMERRLEDTTRRETVFTNILKAWHYNNDLAAVLDRAVALGGNALIELQPGATYTLSAGLTYTSAVGDILVKGNGAIVSVADGIDYGIQLITCTGRWGFYQTRFKAATDSIDSALAALRIEGVAELNVYECYFRHFGIGGINSNTNTTELLQVERSWFYELGNTRNGGSDNGIGITPTYCRVFKARDCGFHTIGTNNNHHGIYGWRGPTTGVGLWSVDGCRFGDDMFSNVYFREDSGEIGTAKLTGNHFNALQDITCTNLIYTANKWKIQAGATDSIALRVSTADTITINSNQFDGNNGGTYTANAIRLLSVALGGTIVGNTIYSCNSGLQKSGAGDMVGVEVHDNVMLDITADAVLINSATAFVMSRCTFRNNTIEATRYCYYFTADTDDCVISGTLRIGTGSSFVRLDGANTGLRMFGNDASGGIDASAGTLVNCNIESPYAIGDATPAVDLVQFADGDATPSVAVGDYFQTANTNPTVITGFDDAVRGKKFWVLVTDAQTTFDVSGSNLSGNGGVDLVAAAGDMLFCFKGASKTHIWPSVA